MTACSMELIEHLLAPVRWRRLSTTWLSPLVTFDFQVFTCYFRYSLMPMCVFGDIRL